MAHEEGCVAQTSNNPVPMCSPLGGMGNTLAVPPLDAIGRHSSTRKRAVMAGPKTVCVLNGEQPSRSVTTQCR